MTIAHRSIIATAVARLAVGLWAAGVDAGVLDVQLPKEAGEGGAAELVAVV
jgi:hypothetical protein